MYQDISKIYKKVGIECLSKRTNKRITRITLKKIAPYLSKSDNILDLGCGYGRISIPLAKEGYNIEGIDISDNLLKRAKSIATDKRILINFKQGDIRKLPYKANSFEKVISLWSVFNEILSLPDQLKSINETYRVLKPDGLAIIDMINGNSLLMKFLVYISFIRYKSKQNIWVAYINKQDDKNKSVKINYYIHNNRTLKNLIQKSLFTRYSISIKSIAGRKRIFLILKKC
jgi:ubiquinone/menaquinone biosynthesis C-methylase UbiE